EGSGREARREFLGARGLLDPVHERARLGGGPRGLLRQTLRGQLRDGVFGADSQFSHGRAFSLSVRVVEGVGCVALTGTPGRRATAPSRAYRCRRSRAHTPATRRSTCTARTGRSRAGSSPPRSSGRSPARRRPESGTASSCG